VTSFHSSATSRLLAGRCDRMTGASGRDLSARRLLQCIDGGYRQPRHVLLAEAARGDTTTPTSMTGTFGSRSIWCR
jgi:hypothetical protein